MCMLIYWFAPSLPRPLCTYDRMLPPSYHLRGTSPSQVIPNMLRNLIPRGIPSLQLPGSSLFC